ncbi:MAG TPA: hypothetical protein VF737_04215, partial [Gemmatimonadaceae bacterium]
MTDTLLRGHPEGVTQGVLVAPHAPAAATSRPTLEPLEVATAKSRADARARAFRQLYERQVDFVWRNLRRLGVDEAEAEDRTQEVFVVAHRRFDEFEDR